MAVDVLLGLQWGDEGKGKIVDVITPGYNAVARFQGGPNAGHSLEFNGIKHVLHTIPSGIFREGIINIVGNGVVIDPVVLKKETDALAKLGVDFRSRLLLSRKAHLILPTHRLLDAASEKSKGNAKIGSTLRGIGPTYMDKTGRNGLRVGDTTSEDFKDKYRFLIAKHAEILKFQDFAYNLSEYEKEWFEGIELVKSLQHVDSEHLLNRYLEEGKRVLAEGAQGSMLDIDFGSYPFVTSSNTITAGACTGLGIAPGNIGKVIGIFKAYCTRVGSGPFPTELTNETGEHLRKKGHEYGATTGRPRRCGWLDLVALKYAIMLNGVTELIMTKADILSGFKKINVCTHYLLNGKKIDYVPYESEGITPVYKELQGWNEDLSELKSVSSIPDELNAYITYIEKELKTPVTIVSVGPDRRQTLPRRAVSAHI